MFLYSNIKENHGQIVLFILHNILDCRTHQYLIINILEINHNLDIIWFPHPFKLMDKCLPLLFAYCFIVLFSYCEYSLLLWVTFSSPHAVNFVMSWTGWVWLLRMWWRGLASSSTDLISTVTRYGLTIGRKKPKVMLCIFYSSVFLCCGWDVGQIVEWCKVSVRKCYLFIHFSLPWLSYECIICFTATKPRISKSFESDI